MKLSKNDILMIREHASTNLANMTNILYWDQNEELDYSERTTLAWIQAVSRICEFKVDVEFKKEVGYESDWDN